MSKIRIIAPLSFMLGLLIVFIAVKIFDKIDQNETLEKYRRRNAEIAQIRAEEFRNDQRLRATNAKSVDDATGICRPMFPEPFAQRTACLRDEDSQR